MVAPYTQADQLNVKREIGEKLFPEVAKLKPDLAGKITGMLLELENSELMVLLESEAQLKIKVGEAIAVLGNVTLAADAPEQAADIAADAPTAADSRLPRNPSPEAPPPGLSTTQAPPADPNTRDRKRARHEPRPADQSRFPKCAQCRNTISAERVLHLERAHTPQAEWRCLACAGKHANWVPALPREAAPDTGNAYGIDGNGNQVSLDGYWSSNCYPLMLMRIAGHVANAAHNQFCLLCPYGRLAQRFCHLSEDGNHPVAIGELIVGELIGEPDRIKWDDGETWFRREGFPSAYVIGDRWSGNPKHLPALTAPNTEWIRQPPLPCYTNFVLYKLCSVCSSSSSNISSTAGSTPGATPKAKPRLLISGVASEAPPPWRKNK